MNTFHALQSSEAGILHGDFVILFKHGHWHLIGTRRTEAGRHIESVHVMSAERARSTLSETPSAKPKTYSEFGPGFEAEVKNKVLAQAEDYLPLFRSRAADLSTGFHTDTVQHVDHSPEKEKAILQAVTHMMESGEPGVCIYFKPHAL